MEVLKMLRSVSKNFDTLPERTPSAWAAFFPSICRREGDNFCKYRPIFRFVLAIPCIGRYNKLVILSASESIAADRK